MEVRCPLPLIRWRFLLVFDGTLKTLDMINGSATPGEEDLSMAAGSKARCMGTGVVTGDRGGTGGRRTRLWDVRRTGGADFRQITDGKSPNRVGGRFFFSHPGGFWVCWERRSGEM